MVGVCGPDRRWPYQQRQSEAGPAGQRDEGGKNITATVETVEEFSKLGRIKTDLGTAGDIVALTGISDVDIGDTIADLEKPVALPRIKVDEPTLSMIFTINSSPFCGKSGGNF